MSTLSKLKKDPENLSLQVALTVRKASVLSLLAEIEFVLRVKPLEDSCKEQHEKLKMRIKKVQEYGQ
jgi:tRNA(Ser,Leu) C12 N-acetylase TAN1